MNKKPLRPRTKRLFLLYDILKHLGYKVDMKYYFTSTRERCIIDNILLLNLVSNILGVKILMIKKALCATIARVRNECKLDTKKGRYLLLGKQLDTRHIDSLPRLLELLSWEYGRDNTKSNEPHSNQGDTTQGKQQE